MTTTAKIGIGVGVAAALGALTSALLFEVIKHAFIAYVSLFPTYEYIYGAVAAVPLFFLWLYCCWLILLVGAVVTYLMGKAT